MVAFSSCDVTRFSRASKTLRGFYNCRVPVVVSVDKAGTARAHRSGIAMFNLKEVLDGLIEDVLELPAMWFRTHLTALACDRRGAIVMARRIRRGDKRYLRFRTAAFCDMLILYAIVNAINSQGPVVNSVLATLLHPQDIPLGAGSQFVGAIIGFFALYYAFYVIIAWLPISPEAARMVLGVCLFYSILCICFEFIVFLLLFGHGSIFAKAFVLRGAMYAFNAIIFWRLGSIVSSVLHLRRRLPYMGTAACAVACFAIYIAVFAICFGLDALWPNLNV
jgi:hypothetical protein